MPPFRRSRPAARRAVAAGACLACALAAPTAPADGARRHAATSAPRAPAIAHTHAATSTPIAHTHAATSTPIARRHAATSTPTARPSSSATTQRTTQELVYVPASHVPPAGRRLSSDAVIKLASALPKMRAVRAKYPGSFGDAYLKVPFRWQVSFFARNGKSEIGLVTIAEGITRPRVLEQWTGFQVAWSMARGYPGAFGRHVDALYVWLPLCLLFMLPFFDFRRPLKLLHLDLLVLLSFSVSLAFFDHAHIYASVPLAYPPLVYLLARMLALARKRARPRQPAALHLLVPARWLALGVVFLIGFRIALNVTDSNVIDVGYAGVIGAQRITSGRPLYGHYPSDNEHGDTYGPVNYEAYVPFEQVFGWSGTWDDLPAAHAAAIAFDLLAIAISFLLGRRVRGPTLGIALAYAWVSYPFTLFALESNSNDALVAVLVLSALLAASYRSKLGPPARGALSALAALTKFAPLALAPMLATYELLPRRAADGTPARARPRARLRALLSLTAFALAFAVAALLASWPALSHDSLKEIYDRTVTYQADRASPFSVWGLYGGLGGLQLAVQIAAVALAIALALIPRGADLVGLAAACAAVVIALQLGIDHWFYLYIPWFFPLVMLALLGRLSLPGRAWNAPAAASGSARSHPPAVAVSS